MAQETANKEVGIIGQMYQNRRTKKVGVLESRNDKYKTLMFRTTDGGSFTVVYSTFRSDWRKYQGDEVAETSTQVEEKKAKEKAAEEKLEKPAKKSDKVKISKEDRIEATGALYDTVSSIVEKSKAGLSVKLNAKGGVNVKDGHKSVLGAWVSDVPGIYSLYTNIDMIFSDSVGDIDYEHRENWKLKNRYRMKSIKKAVTEVITQYISTKEVKEDK